MHRVADEVQRRSVLPLLHIADATGQAVKESGLKRVALLGTAITMEEGFYKDRLRDKFGLDVLVPQKSERDFIHRVIFEELCLGNDCRFTVHSAMSSGAWKRKMPEGIILGCTELPVLLMMSRSAFRFSTPLLCMPCN